MSTSTYGSYGTPGLPASSTGPVSPFLKSSNSEYGNWFKSPLSPFAAINSHMPSPNTHIGAGGRKLSVRRGLQGLQSSIYGIERERSITGASLHRSKTDVGFSFLLNTKHSPSPPVQPGSERVPLFERSSSYSGEASPRQESNANYSKTFGSNSHGIGTLERSNTTLSTNNHGVSLERSNTSVLDMGTPRNYQKATGLLRAGTFTEGMSTPNWKTLNNRDYGDINLSPRMEAIVAESMSNNFDIFSSNISGNTGSLTLPSVSASKTSAATQRRANLKSAHPFGSGYGASGSYGSRASSYNDTTSLSRQNSGFFSSINDNSNPYNLDSLIEKQYSPRSPRSRGYEADNHIPLETREISFLNESHVTPKPHFPKTAVKSILKKKSAYDNQSLNNSNYFSFSRSATSDDNGFLTTWPGYSNSSTFGAYINSSHKYQNSRYFPNETAAFKALPDVGQQRPSVSGKKVTFLL